MATDSVRGITGINSLNPFDVTPGTITTPGTAVGVVNPSSVTTVTPSSLILMLGMNCRTAGIRNFNNAGWVTTSPGTLTEIADASGVSGIAAVDAGAGALVKPTAGATGTGTLTFSNTGAYGGSIILALRPGTKQFRSKSGGPWDQTWVWEQSIDGGASWVAATSVPNANSSVQIQNGHTVTVSAANALANDLTVDGSLTISSTYSLTLSATAAINGTLTIQNTGTIVKGTGNITFNSGSTYVHARDGGTIPTSVWDVNSNCNITGITGTVPTGLGQTFGNFTWNCTGQTGNIALAGALTTINGNFTVSSTNVTNQLQLRGNGGALNVNGNFSLTSGILNLNTGTGTSTMYLAGNFTHTGGTLTESGGGNGIVVFDGTTQQLYTSGGTVSNTVNFTVNSGAILQMGTGASPSTISGAGTFTLSNGATLGITSPAGIVSLGTAAGNIQSTVGRSFSTSANYIYNGTAAQATGTGLPTNLVTPSVLTISNSAGVSLSAATTTSGTVNLISGTLTTTSNLLSVTNTSTSAISGGSSTSYVNGPLRWTLPANLVSGSTYNFPIGVGQASPSLNYYPISLENPTTGGTGPVVQLEAKQAASGGTANVTAPLVLKSNTEYWQLTIASGNFTNSSISITRPTTISPLNMISGCATLTGNYTTLGGAYGTYGVYGSGLIGASRFFTFAQSNTATLSVSKSSLTGLSYVFGNGPSSEQSFQVSGIGLTNNVTVSPPASYEISTISGTGFQSTPLTLVRVSGTVSSTIYVRLRKDLNIGSYNSQNISVSSSPLASKTVVCSGSVVGQTIVVGYKSGIPVNNNYVINGSDRTNAGAKLTNSANFGPSGTSPYSFVLYDFGSNAITEASLNANGVQILDLGINVNDAASGTLTSSYTTQELNEIKSWTSSSNSHVVLTYQGITSALGVGYTTNGTGNLNPNAVTATGLSVLNGPFPVAGGNSYSQGGSYQGSYSAYPGTACLLTQAANGNATGLINILSGDIYLADVGFIGETGGLTAAPTITSQTDGFFANLYHSMARIVQYGPDDICAFFSCAAGVVAPVLSASYTSVNCATQTANINSFSINSPPGGTSLVWFTNPNHTGAAYATPTTAGIGTYYAFYYDASGGCYSPASLPFVVQTGIVVNTTSLSGFSYVLGNGPSSQQILSVSGTCLSNDIVITPPANYEVSIDGINFQTSAITLTQTAGSVGITNVFVRLVAGLAINDYIGNIIVSSAGVTTKYVDVVGSVVAVSYCTSVGTTANQTSITYVQLNTISNSSAKPAGYTDYSTISTNALVGSSYLLTVRLNTAGNRTVYCKVWIDWNKDGDFADAGEEYLLGSVTNGVNGMTSLSPLSITVPVGAVIGLTRMRVSCNLSAYPASSCDNGFDGEVEDYRINIVKNYWRGNISTDWGTSANWTAFIPSTTDDVVYSTGTPYTAAVNDLVLDQSRTINSLTNATTKRLIIPPSLTLNVTNTITTNNNNPDLIYIQSSSTLPNGSLTYHNLQSSPIYGTVEMYSKGHSIAAPGVEFPVGSGNKYRYSWQYFGIPVTSIPANPTFYGSYVRRWYEPGPNMTNHWVQLANNDPVNPFYGYEITQDVPVGKTIVFTGQLINWDWETPTSLIRSSGVDFPGQYIFANPYTTAINITNFLTTNTSNDIDMGQVYMYTTGSYADWGIAGKGVGYGNNTGQYQVCTKVTGIGCPTQIPSMGAVLVQIGTGGLTNSKVTFHYSDVAAGGNTEMQRVKGKVGSNTLSNIDDGNLEKNVDMESTTSKMPYLMIEVSGSEFADRMWVFADSTFSRTYDKGWDGFKKLGIALAPQLYALEADGAYQINCVNNINNTVIGFQRGIDAKYTFTFTNINTEKKYAGIYLLDSIDNKIIDITQSGSTYTFTVDTVGKYNNRFRIVARNIEENSIERNSKLKLFSANGKIFVDNQSNERGEFCLYDMTGRIVRKSIFAPKIICEVGSVRHYGIYIGRATISTEDQTERLIMNQK